MTTLTGWKRLEFVLELPHMIRKICGTMMCLGCFTVNHIGVHFQRHLLQAVEMIKQESYLWDAAMIMAYRKIPS